MEMKGRVLIYKYIHFYYMCDVIYGWSLSVGKEAKYAHKQSKKLDGEKSIQHN